MPLSTVDGLISRLELVLPKNVLQTCVSLQRGFAAEFLSTNLHKCTASRIKVAKQIDESVRLTVSVSRLQGENPDRPEHILIHGLKDDAYQDHQNTYSVSHQRTLSTPQFTNEKVQPTATEAPCEVTSTVNPQDTEGVIEGLGPPTIDSPNTSTRPNLDIPVLPAEKDEETNESEMAHSLDQGRTDTIQDHLQECLPPGTEDTPSQAEENDKASTLPSCGIADIAEENDKASTLPSCGIDDIAEENDKASTLPSCGIDDIDLSTLSSSVADVGKLVDTQEAADILSSLGESELKRTLENWEHEELTESLYHTKSSSIKTNDVNIEMKDNHLIYVEAEPTGDIEANVQIHDGHSQAQSTSSVEKTNEQTNPCIVDCEQSEIPIDGDSVMVPNKITRKENVIKLRCTKSNIRISKRNQNMDRSHMSRPHYKREQNVQCQFCPAKLKDNESLFEHAKLKHCHVKDYTEFMKALRELLKVTCQVCNRVYSRREQLSVHMNLMHSPNTAEDCPKCGVRVKSKRHLNEHIRRVHNNTERVHLCHLCPASFRLPSYLSAHLRFVHTANREDAFPCDECDKTYSSDKYLSNHKTRVHSSRRHVCGYCGKTFTTYPNMQRHVLLLHEKKGEKPFQCEVCGRRFSLKANLKDHVNTLHLNSYPVHCSVCDLGFRRKKDLHIHQAHAHGASEPPSASGVRQFAPTTSQGPITIVPAVSDSNQAHSAGENPAVQYIMATPEILQVFGIQVGSDTGMSGTGATGTPIQFSTDSENGDSADPGADIAGKETDDFNSEHQQTMVIQPAYDQDDVPAHTAESETVEGCSVSETAVTTMDIS